MAKSYYTLVVRDDDGVWRPEFGDYSRSVVAGELDDYRDHGFTKSHLAIIKTGDAQRDIDVAVKLLNALT